MDRRRLGTAGDRRRLTLSGACLAAMAAACAPIDPPPPGLGDANLSQCPLIDNRAFVEFQLDRETALAELEHPDPAPRVLVKPREGQAQALYAVGPMQDAGVMEMEARSGGLFEVSLPQDADADAFAQSLQAFGRVVEYAQPSVTFYPSVEPDDPCYAAQWHYWSRDTGELQAPGGIDLPARWATTTGSADVVVAVIDTGIARNVDLESANLVPGFDFVGNAFNGGDGDGRDADPTDPGDLQQSFHGTHVAGTVGAAATNNDAGIASVNWTVSVQPIRALGLLGGSNADIVDAIRWAAGLPVPGVPTNATPADIINMSLGGGAPCDRATQDAVNDATEAGTLVIAAAGNDGRDASGFVPAGCDNVLTVAASDLRGVLTSYSNFGADVEILAPGGDTRQDRNNDGIGDGVLSLLRDGVGNYNGTSMAAPHVAGVAALLLAENPDLTPAELTEALQANAIPRSNAQCPRPCGAGLLNAAPAPVN